MSVVSPELTYREVDDVFVDGVWRRADPIGWIEVVNPATEETWGRAPASGAADLDRAVAAARRAFDGTGWRDLPPADRAAAMLRLAEEIEKRAVPLAHTVTAENGTPIAETALAAAHAGSVLRYFASFAGYLNTPETRPFPDRDAETVVRWDAVGVCALIAPWNFPINLVLVKLAPALIAGCTVVIKPASPTPLSIRFIADAAAAAGIPPGVINVVTGRGDLGDALVRHPGIDKVAFTGSTPVGRGIAAACGELLRPVTLELGGKSSAIILEEADLEQFASVLVRTCLRNTGQTCYISTRILAPAARYDEVVDVVTRTVAAQRQGDPMDPGTVLGPVAHRGQFESVRAHISAGIAEGARATTGGALGTPFERGFYVTPTVFADVTPGMRIAREEIFGPVLTVLRYGSEDEAVALANDTDFGLGGTVFSSEPDRALAVARRVDTGSMGINFFASNHTAPFAGRRDSGLGVEFGREGLHAYLKPQSIHRHRP